MDVWMCGCAHDSQKPPFRLKRITGYYSHLHCHNLSYIYSISSHLSPLLPFHLISCPPTALSTPVPDFHSSPSLAVSRSCH